MHVTSILMNPTGYCFCPRKNLVYLSNQLVEKKRNERPVWHQRSHSIISFPIFPQRPLNLTAIWQSAAITIHSWVKINLWDSSLGQGFEDSFSPTCARLCAGYINLQWFILSVDDAPRVILKGSTVRVYNIIQTKFKGEAKIEILPHEEVQTRNSLFDGYIFQRCNDGVFLERFKSCPHLWFGVGWLHTWLACCLPLHKTQKVWELKTPHSIQTENAKKKSLSM